MGNMQIESRRGCLMIVPRDEDTFNYIISQRVVGDIRGGGILLNDRQLDELKRSKVNKIGGEYFLKTSPRLCRSDVVAIAVSFANKLGKAIRYKYGKINFTARPGDSVSELEAKLMKM